MVEKMLCAVVIHSLGAKAVMHATPADHIMAAHAQGHESMRRKITYSRVGRT